MGRLEQRQFIKGDICMVMDMPMKKRSIPLVMRKMQIKAIIKTATQPLEWLNNPGCWQGCPLWQGTLPTCWWE